MVSVQEAQTRISQQRTAFEQAQRQVEAYKPPELTRQQLARATPQQQALRQAQQKQIEISKQKSIQDIQQKAEEFEERVADPVQRQIKTYQAQKRAYDEEVAEWKSAERYARRGITPIGESRGLIKKWEQIREEGLVGEPLIAWKEPTGEIRYESIDPTIAEAQGLTPIAVHPESLRELPQYTIEFQEPEIPEFSFEEIPPTILEVAPTGLEAVKQRIEIEGFRLKERLKEVFITDPLEAERKLSELARKKLPPIKFIYEKAPEIAERIIERGVERAPIEFRKTEEAKKIIEFERGFIPSLIREPIERPVKTIGLLTLGYVAPKILAPAISWLGKAGVTGKVITTGLKYGIPATYVGLKGVEVYVEPEFEEKGKIIGRAISGEILPLYIGGKLSQYDKTLIRKFLNQQKKLFYDIEGRAGRSKGTRQTTKVVEKGKTKTKVKKKINIDKIITDLKYKKVGKTIRNKNFQEKLKDVRQILNKVKTKTELESVKKLLNEAYGETEANRLITEFISQEISDVIPSGRFAGLTPEGKIKVDLTGRITGLGILEGKIPTGILEKPPIEKPKITPKIETKFIVGLGQVQVPKQEQAQRQLLAQLQLLMQKTKLTQKERQKVKQLEGQLTGLGLMVIPRLAQEQITKQIPKTIQFFETPRPIPTKLKPKPKPKPEIIWIGLPEEERKRRKRVKKRVKKIPPEKSWDVLAKPEKQKKYKKIGRRLKSSEAEDWGAEIVDKSMSAQFKLRENPKPPLKPKVPLKKGYYQKHKKKFRKYKIRKKKKIPTPLSYIEKRGKRLDTPSEVKRINMFKKIAELKKKRIKKVKKKTTKRKTKKKIFTLFKEEKKKKKQKKIKFF